MCLQVEVQFAREVCGELEIAESREWLVTNGLGGYASGTIAGTTTRRYHGLLVAALEPPVKRTVLVNAFDEIVRYRGSNFSLGTNRWTSGFVSPKGYLQLESFCLQGCAPVWRYALEDALLEKRIWMKQGENTTYVQFALIRGLNIDLDVKVLVNYRDFHNTTQGADWSARVDVLENGLRVVAFEGAVPIYLKSASGSWTARNEWYRNYFLPAEQQRGLDDHEDRLYVAQFHCSLHTGEPVTLVLSTEQDAALDGEEARSARSNHELQLFQSWQTHRARSCAHPADQEPSWLWQLVLAADQFIAKRVSSHAPNGHTIIAGYHWFNDWGRDTMIALPGLTLTMGRPEIARDILLSMTRYVDSGMLPNDFPDAGGTPGYNTVDATLWLFEAIRQYFEVTHDRDTLSELYPVFVAIIDAHVRGTRYDIRVDPTDALLHAGTPDVQLTWMDAKVGDWVVTPRTGKPVEVNALWINALHTTATVAKLLGQPSEAYERLKQEATDSFQKFWNAERQCCYDVIDTPSGGKDSLLRPNQIFAVSLPVSPLTSTQQKAVVDIVASQLLTSHGLRSLGPFEPGYKGEFGGGPRERDSAYHQGTVWGWLLGPFALAHFRVYQDPRVAQSFLESLGRTILSAGLGTLGEIFTGDPPFTSVGAIAQAWTVGEVLRAWQMLSAAEAPADAAQAASV
ncbi:MAG TPA: amylo-alpha-1,6-glucosidase [Candidatus Eremiobacteraceae bacterium]|nr:amylo-alpha-1,6-glucosidase [Candidatus Eremiobacteraceae bacterium]